MRLEDTLKLKSLIEEGFDINSRYNHNSYSKQDYLLNRAILYEKRGLTEYILKQHDAKNQLVEKDNSTTLHYLVLNGWYDLAKELIESGVDPNTLGRKQMHILRVVIGNYRWRYPKPNLQHNTEALEFIQFLYSEGIQPELSIQCCRKKTTILNLSVQTLSFSAVEYILQHHRESINWLDHKGKTALHWAVENEQIDVVRLLVENGANPQITDKKGNSPIEYARDLENEILMDFLQKASNKA